jgi:hypothetical protein
MQLVALAVVLLANLLVHSAHGHSWVEQVSQISTDGSFFGSPGFPRGNGEFEGQTLTRYTWLTYASPPNLPFVL